MDYDTALISGADIARYSFVQDLANLVTDAEITLNNCALEGSRWVFKELEASGVDPTLITNETRLYRAVALMTCALFQQAGYLGGTDPELFERKARVEIHGDERGKGGFRPTYATLDSPRRASEGIPAVGHRDQHYGDQGYSDVVAVT